jgi:hypothetical protein
VLRSLITAKGVPNLLILSTAMEAMRSSETSTLTKETRNHVTEDGILQSLSLIHSSPYLTPHLEPFPQSVAAIIVLNLSILCYSLV